MESMVWLLDTQPAAHASHSKNLETIRNYLRRVAYPRSVFVGDGSPHSALQWGNARLVYAAPGDMADPEAFRTMLVMQGALTPEDTFTSDYGWPNPSPLCEAVRSVDAL